MIRVVCPKCYAQFDAQDVHAGRRATCPNCGTPITIPGGSSPGAPPGLPPASGPPPMPQPTSYAAGAPGAPAGNPGVGLAGMICGIIGFVLSLVAAIPCVGCLVLPVGVPTAIAGLVCSIIGLVVAKKRRQRKAFSIIGLIFSIVALVWGPLVFFIFLGGLGALGAASPPPPSFRPPR